MTPARLTLAVACAIALWIRAGIPFYSVFQSGFVNFQETDAWFHVRIIEHLVRHFPHRLFIDPYGAVLDGQRVDTGPFYDWLAAALALPFPQHLHEILAWYPALLGVAIVVAVYFLTRQLSPAPAAALAALIAATLPGYFLAISSLGFTDHHVMESLLSTLVICCLLRGRPILAGLTLGAYLLTFVGGAFLVAVLTAWAAYGFLRHPEDESYTAPLLPAFAIALPLAALANGILWTEYSLAALAAGLATVTLAKFTRPTKHPRAYWLAGLLLPAAIGVALFPQALGVLQFLSPNRSGVASAVAELQSFWFGKGFFSLDWAWQQFGGVYVLAAIGIALLAEAAVKRPEPKQTLFLFWSLAVFALSISQVRMVYYFAPVAAILAGQLIHRAWSTTSNKQRPFVALAAFAFAFAPNLWTLTTEPFPANAAVPPRWRDALEWLRAETPEPFGDPAAYTATAVNPAAVRYGVLTWWDYGYWITALGRRVPLSNPTQKNASVAAAFFLSQSEPDALAIMRQWRLRYAIFDSRLADPLFPAFFPFTQNQQRSSFLLEGFERQPDGKRKLRRFYLPAYYQTMANRLARGGRAAEPGGALLVTRRTADAVFEQITPYSDAQDAIRAQAECAIRGCVLVGDRPEIPCVPVAALSALRQVYPPSGPAPVTIFEAN